jgi:hypothetical protein
MSIIGTSDEPDMGRYNPTLEQLAEQYHPIREPVVGQHHPIDGQALVSNTNNIKQENFIKQPKGRQAVIIFFEENNFDVDEGKKFFEHYQTRNWQTSDGQAIRDWRALATNWMDRTELFDEKNESNKKQASQIKDNLRTTKNKDYGQPL